ncbi:hypothetical protein L2E82_14041 [Cichorium intybus]|uniref:Uncharacterized protein n=1 Tax=Cichorium intybus TaxID=13427 RepID=A0ACB9EZ85_CICIN|nr:hypothetical protein L2E82_14041 [Cichorium intybus]
MTKIVCKMTSMVYKKDTPRTTPLSPEGFLIFIFKGFDTFGMKFVAGHTKYLLTDKSLSGPFLFIGGTEKLAQGWYRTNVWMLSGYTKCMQFLNPICLRSRQIFQNASVGSPELSTPKAVSTIPPKGLNFYISRLQTCESVDQLHQLHAAILKTHASQNVFLLTRLAHAYLKFGCPTVGERFVVSIIKNPPLFLWNETIKCYARKGCYRESIDLYYEMVRSGYKPNAFTFTFVLPACTGLKSVSDGRRVHADALLFGCENNEFVITALIDGLVTMAW